MAKVLLTGATGFVGQHVYPALIAAGHQVVCATRDVEFARRKLPGRHWVACDVTDRASVERALRRCEAAYYLVHEVGASGNYPEREARAALAFRDAAHHCGLERLVYLGGVAPRGRVSRHLQSRLRCGEYLRSGQVPTFELRAAMIIGHGSVSWQIVYDLAQRLPAMVLPHWMQNHSWPVAIEDVVYALVAALRLPIRCAGVYDVPGPERLTHRETLLRAAALLDKHPVTVGVPFVSPRLSSYWMGLVTRAPLAVARELVQGLRADLDPSGATFWSLVPEHALSSVDEAMRNACRDEGSHQVPSGPTRARLEVRSRRSPGATPHAGTP